MIPTSRRPSVSATVAVSATTAPLLPAGLLIFVTHFFFRLSGSLFLGRLLRSSLWFTKQWCHLLRQGVIKNKSLLPVTALYFGGQGSKWTGRHTLGRIECTGSARPAQNVEGLPSNCQDLRILGHSLSGFYSVRTRDGQMSTVFCDMSRPSTDLGNSIFQ